MSTVFFLFLLHLSLGLISLVNATIQMSQHRNDTTEAFNMADAIQWIGYILVVYGLIRDGSLLWPDVNARKNLWINPTFQIKYILTIVGIGSSFAMVTGVFAYTFLKVTIDDLAPSR